MTTLEKIEELEKEIQKLKGIEVDTIPTYSFSKIKFSELETLVDIEKEIDRTKFDNWFTSKVDIKSDIEQFLKNLILENQDLVYDYSEEDLKVNLIIPILNLVKFKSFENQFRDFYELALRYETDRFILKGTTDFVVSKGLIRSKKPYFFIQEFKKGQTDGYPESQLLAELIAGVELNNWQTIRGAYIVGAIWNFVILEKLGVDKYQYFVSQNFDSTKLEDLKDIYKNLLFVKSEIIKENNS